LLVTSTAPFGADTTAEAAKVPSAFTTTGSDTVAVPRRNLITRLDPFGKVISDERIESCTPIGNGNFDDNVSGTETL
jgi:hypothetical protein